MPIQKKNTHSTSFSWKSKEVDCYYESALLVNRDHCKFYNSFLLIDTHYKVGDFAFIRSGFGPQKICSLECLYEIRGNCEAVVNLYDFAVNYEEYFRQMNVEFDEENEVVWKATEKAVIDLKHITGKCRVICGSEDETVSEAIDCCNLNREIYFFCRYKYIKDFKLVPVLSGTIVNDVSIVEEVGDSFSNETPLLKILDSVRRPCHKKTLSELMDIEEDFHDTRLDQVKKNLNKSFSDSIPESELIKNYSIVEQSDEKSLKIRLRVSNGKVLSNIPSTQPIVLVDSIDKFTTNSEENVIYELKSPEFRSVLEAEVSKGQHNLKEIRTKSSKKKSRAVKKDTELVETVEMRPISPNFWPISQCETVDPKISESVSYKQPDTPSKLSDLSNMVENLKINEKSPIKVSPRKLRKLSKPLYYGNCQSDSDSENYPQRRKSVRNRNSRVKHMQQGCYEVGMSNTQNLNDSKEYKKFLNDTSESESEKNVKKNIVRRKLGISENQFSPNSPKVNSLKKIEINRQSINSTPQTKTNKTSKNTPLKLIREGMLTPAIDQRRQTVVKSSTPLLLARNNLHVSYVPTVLPCRENEYDDVYNFIEGKLFDKCGGCMYISGVPGTGKTATVTVAIENLIKNWKNKNYPEFNYVSVNGMRLTEPRQCYVEILKQLSGKRVPWEQALSVLEEKFTTKSSKKVVPTVLLVDELDILCTKRQDVVYNLLDWPTKANAQLIVVTIANTMDLPERLLMSRVTSRLGLTRLTFQAYTHKQLQEIVLNRLTGNNSFKSDAVQFVARKVASVSGDARRALDICRRSAEIAEMEGCHTQVSMKHVNAALDAMMTQPKVKAITHCSRLEKLLLQSIVAEVERTGIEETVFGDVYTMLISLAALDGFKMVSVSLVASAVYRLSSSRLLLIDQKCMDFNQRIILNVSADDIYYALKND